MIFLFVLNQFFLNFTEWNTSMYDGTLDSLWTISIAYLYQGIADYTSWLKQNNLCNTLHETFSQKIVKKLFFETIS